ncbi:MAG: hypothetical protein C4K58_06050 [Flavobacteriaceae bacterium]|nr:MAG: hypothetical protein C4K58_06050 [Flavobacteriaceae bacterium]
MYGTEFFAILKAIHIIFMVSYFAGIFYIIRLFIYHKDALDGGLDKDQILSKQFIMMESRLWNIIIVPAGLLMALSGLLMLSLNWSFFSAQIWMKVKLLFVFFLLVYHIFCWKLLKLSALNQINLSSTQLRMYNEIPTLILFVVVFAVILKNYFVTHWYWLLVSFIGMGAVIMLAVKWVNRNRK